MNATRPIAMQIATSYGRRGGYYPPAGDKLSPLRILSKVFYILQHALFYASDVETYGAETVENRRKMSKKRR